MAILVNNSQEMPADEESIKRIATGVLESEGVSPDAELSIALVGENDIAELNSRYLGEEGPTDVLAFPMDEPSGGGEARAVGEADGEGEAAGPLLLGDVVISPEVARRQAVTLGHSYEKELGVLLIHGILHLLGYTHDEEEDAGVMKDKESALAERLLKAAAAE